jgi:ADP-ribose pyrophosphatase YjhB (NUDIX family)
MNSPKIFAPAERDWPIPKNGLHVLCFAIITRAGKILLEKRKEPEWHADHWTLPEYVLRYGEDAREKLIDLVREDLGIQLHQMVPLQVQSQVGEHWCLCLLYWGRIRKIGKLSSSIQEVGFFDAKDPPEGMHEFHRYVLEDLDTLPG